MNNSANGQFGQRSMPIIPKTASEALRPEQGTPPPRRSRQARNRWVVFLNFLLTTVVVGLVAGGLALYFGNQAFEAEGPADLAGLFMVRPSTGVSEIASQLERQGYITDARVFQVAVRAYGTAGELKAGEYEIKAKASMREIMELLHSGKSVLHSLPVPEGFTVSQALERIRKHEALSGEMPAEVPVEGSLIADTQRFERGTTRAAIVNRMVAEQKKLVESIWERRVDDLPVATIEEFVTLASIVEKETGKSDERSRVAAVFVNRLRQGMRLQSDPTIIYGLFGGAGRPEGWSFTDADMKKPTPYNTYVIDGLPPTPIANPGRAALEAVANPSRTKDLYFVADGSGGHVFAETLDEHNENVARYWALRKQADAEAAKAAAAAAAAETTGGTEADTAAD